MIPGFGFNLKLRWKFFIRLRLNTLSAEGGLRGASSFVGV